MYGGVTAKQMRHVRLDELESEIASSRKSLQLHVNLCRAVRH